MGWKWGRGERKEEEVKVGKSDPRGEGREQEGKGKWDHGI